MQHIIGVDIGGTKCAVILGILNGKGLNIIDKIKFPTVVLKGPESTLSNIENSMNNIIARNKLTISNIKSIGISCGGPLDSKRGIIMSPPNLPGWDNIHIVERFGGTFKVPVKIQNDANACALAEWKFGAAKGFNNVVFLTFGTGMGAGLILDGRLYRGTCDMAGEVGHIRLAESGPVGFGKAGSFEGFCSGGGIAQLARTMVMEKLQMGEKVSFCDNFDKLNSLDAKIVGDAAEAGDMLAMEIYLVCGKYLGKGLSLLIDILNPQIIVIGSIFARSTGLLWPEAEKIIKRESLVFSRKVCKVVSAGLGDSIGDYAAISVAVYE